MKKVITATVLLSLGCASHASQGPKKNFPKILNWKSKTNGGIIHHARVYLPTKKNQPIYNQKTFWVGQTNYSSGKPSTSHHFDCPCGTGYKKEQIKKQLLNSIKKFKRIKKKKK